MNELPAAENPYAAPRTVATQAPQGPLSGLTPHPFQVGEILRASLVITYRHFWQFKRSWLVISVLSSLYCLLALFMAIFVMGFVIALGARLLRLDLRQIMELQFELSVSVIPVYTPLVFVLPLTLAWGITLHLQILKQGNATVAESLGAGRHFFQLFWANLGVLGAGFAAGGLALMTSSFLRTSTSWPIATMTAAAACGLTLLALHSLLAYGLSYALICDWKVNFFTAIATSARLTRGRRFKLLLLTACGLTIGGVITAICFTSAGLAIAGLGTIISAPVDSDRIESFILLYFAILYLGLLASITLSGTYCSTLYVVTYLRLTGQPLAAENMPLRKT